MGLYNDILEHLEARGLCFVRKFVPYFLASFGDHIFNIRNNQFNDVNEPLAIYWENQRIPDMRLFILFIAPPGFSKSTFLQHLLRDFYGVLADCGIETYFKAYMTEAALVGSFGGDEKKAESLPLKGFLENHRNCIVGIEEFSSLLAASKQEHSKGLDSALLDWATHGEITKDLRRGEISFKTNATLWAGTQLGKERIELRGGMANKTMINEIIGPHYHCGGSKDCWRYYYVHWWHNIVFRKSTYDLVRPVKDATGNDISNSRSYSGLEINKPLLKKGLRSREDVNFYNRDLSGLNCVSFFWRPETKSQHARFWLRRDKENKTFTWFNESFFEEER